MPLMHVVCLRFRADLSEEAIVAHFLNEVNLKTRMPELVDWWCVACRAAPSSTERPRRAGPAGFARAPITAAAALHRTPPPRLPQRAALPPGPLLTRGRWGVSAVVRAQRTRDAALNLVAGSARFAAPGRPLPAAGPSGRTSVSTTARTSTAAASGLWHRSCTAQPTFRCIWRTRSTRRWASSRRRC